MVPPRGVVFAIERHFAFILDRRLRTFK